MSGRRRAVVAGVAAVIIAALSTLTPGHAAVRDRKQELTLGSVWRIWPLGDSITLGSGAPVTPGGYRDQLDRTLSFSGLRHKFVGTSTLNTSPILDLDSENHHDGHGGYRIDQVAADLTGIAGADTDNDGNWLNGSSTRAPIYPDVVLIHLGTNDIAQRYDPGVRYPTTTHLVDFADASQRQLFVSHASGRLTALIDRIYSLRPHARVVLSAIIPIVKPAYRVAGADFAAATHAIVQREQQLGHPIVLANMYQAFLTKYDGRWQPTPGLVGTDGMHPTPLGYQQMARVYADAVRKVVAR